MAKFNLRSLSSDGLFVLLVVVVSFVASALEVVALRGVAYGAIGPVAAALGSSHAPQPSDSAASAAGAGLIAAERRPAR